MPSTTIILQLAVAIVPAVGLFILAIDRMSSQKSITMRTIIQVIGLTLVPAVIILGLNGMLTSPVVTGFLGVTFGYVLGNLVSQD